VKDAFGYIGIAFVFFSLLIVIGEMYEAARRGQRMTNQEYLRTLGLAGFMVWTLIVLGVASWLISLPFRLLLGW
jgi:hypothetical protein